MVAACKRDRGSVSASACVSASLGEMDRAGLGEYECEGSCEFG